MTAPPPKSNGSWTGDELLARMMQLEEETRVGHAGLAATTPTRRSVEVGAGSVVSTIRPPASPLTAATAGGGGGGPNRQPTNSHGVMRDIEREMRETQWAMEISRMELIEQEQQHSIVETAGGCLLHANERGGRDVSNHPPDDVALFSDDSNNARLLTTGSRSQSMQHTNNSSMNAQQLQPQAGHRRIHTDSHIHGAYLDNDSNSLNSLEGQQHDLNVAARMQALRRTSNPLEYARMLQEQAFSDLQRRGGDGGLDNNGAALEFARSYRASSFASSAEMDSSTKKSDYEIALDMQKLEEEGMGRENSRRRVLDSADLLSPSNGGVADALVGTWQRNHDGFYNLSQQQQQQHVIDESISSSNSSNHQHRQLSKDEKLARFMEEAGVSFSQLPDDVLQNVLVEDEVDVLGSRGGSSLRSSSDAEFVPNCNLSIVPPRGGGMEQHHSTHAENLDESRSQTMGGDMAVGIAAKMRRSPVVAVSAAGDDRSDAPPQFRLERTGTGVSRFQQHRSSSSDAKSPGGRRSRTALNRVISHSAPNTPTNSSNKSAIDLAGMLPGDVFLNEIDSAKQQDKGRLKKKRFLVFGNRGSKNSDEAAPSATTAAAIPAQIPPPPGYGIPRSIPPPPGGSLSIPPPATVASISPIKASSVHATSFPLALSATERSPLPSSLRLHHSHHHAGLTSAAGHLMEQARTTPVRKVIPTTAVTVTPPPPPTTSTTIHGRFPPPPKVFPGVAAAPPSSGRDAFLQQQRNTFSVCAVCHRSAGGSFLMALDLKYHRECFRCAICNERIDSAGQFKFGGGGPGKKQQPYHIRCYAEAFGVRCTVCKLPLVATGMDGKVTYVKHPFFDKEIMCLRHAEHPGRRCTGCQRFEPEDEPFADLPDAGRCVCYACCRTVVVDNDDVHPIWMEVLSFLSTSLGMPIWKGMAEIPVLVVGYDELTYQMTRRDDPHTRSKQLVASGLCLTEHGQRFKLQTLEYNASTSSFETKDDERRGFTYYEIPGDNNNRKARSSEEGGRRVSAILCLSGLPRTLLASTLAHEAVHAWFRLHPQYDYRRPLPAKVEEGCAQLITMLFLEDGLQSHKMAHVEEGEAVGPSDDELRRYYQFSIERDESDIFGAGYSMAGSAYQRIGLEALLNHVLNYREFPQV